MSAAHLEDGEDADNFGESVKQDSTTYVIQPRVCQVAFNWSVDMPRRWSGISGLDGAPVTWIGAPLPVTFRQLRSEFFRAADGEGFEPSLPFGKHAFQACAIDHSATHPWLLRLGGAGRE
jgi:hypothetical protein